MIATCGLFAVSRSPKSLPATKGMPAVAKYRGLIQLMCSEALPSPAPSTRNPPEEEQFAMSPHVAAAESTTPGTLRAEATRRRASAGSASSA